MSDLTLFHRDRKNRRLVFQAELDEICKRARFEFYSDRNHALSSLTDVSPFDPDPTPGQARYEKNCNVFFPVIDLEPEPSMYAAADIEGVRFCHINSYFHPEPIPVHGGTAIFESAMLSHWENGLYVPDKNAEVGSFWMVKEVVAVPSISRRMFCEVTALDEAWGGTVHVSYETQDGMWHSGPSMELVRDRDQELKQQGSDSEDVALRLCLDYIIHSVNQSDSNPFYGGLFLFYDCDADTYRNGQWPWSWGTAVKFLLECADCAEDPKQAALLGRSSKELTDLAYRIGITTLKFRISSDGHPAHKFGTTRYTVRNFSDTGYEELVNTGSDTGFLCGWAWIPLYEATGDERFLQAAREYLAALADLLPQVVLPPQEWLPGPGTWTSFTIDESGFGTEGIEGAYRITKDPTYRSLCISYMEKHLSVFEREDGFWNRLYSFPDGKVEETAYMTRGMGWAMEGLLAAHRCAPEGDRYLKKAVQMAEELIRYQNEDGSFGFRFTDPYSPYDRADKGTALWSLLLFMLYEETGEKNHLKAARAALSWCMAHQYTGNHPHVRGGIISVSGESGVTYRPYFRLCCQYTSSFMGLALLRNRNVRI